MTEFTRRDLFDDYEEIHFEKLVMEDHSMVLSVLNQLTNDEELAEVRASEIVMNRFFASMPENMTYHEAFTYWCSLPSGASIV